MTTKQQQEQLGKALWDIANQARTKKIATILSSADALIASQTEKIAILKDHKKGLLQQLFPTINALSI